MLNFQKKLGDEKTESYNVIEKSIQIKPGMGIKSEMRFVGEGHQRFGHHPSDLVIRFT